MHTTRCEKHVTHDDSQHTYIHAGIYGPKKLLCLRILGQTGGRDDVWRCVRTTADSRRNPPAHHPGDTHLTFVLPYLPGKSHKYCFGAYVGAIVDAHAYICMCSASISVCGWRCAHVILCVGVGVHMVHSALGDNAFVLELWCV